MLRKLMLIALIMLIVALSLAACGDGSSQPASQTSQPTASLTSAPSAQATAVPKPTVTSTPGPQTIEVKYTLRWRGTFDASRVLEWRCHQVHVTTRQGICCHRK